MFTEEYLSNHFENLRKKYDNELKDVTSARILSPETTKLPTQLESGNLTNCFGSKAVMGNLGEMNTILPIPSNLVSQNQVSQNQIPQNQISKNQIRQNQVPQNCTPQIVYDDVIVDIPEFTFNPVPMTGSQFAGIQGFNQPPRFQAHQVVQSPPSSQGPYNVTPYNISASPPFARNPQPNIGFQNNSYSVPPQENLNYAELGSCQMGYPQIPGFVQNAANLQTAANLQNPRKMLALAKSTQTPAEKLLTLQGELLSSQQRLADLERESLELKSVSSGIDETEFKRKNFQQEEPGCGKLKLEKCNYAARPSEEDSAFAENNLGMDIFGVENPTSNSANDCGSSLIESSKKNPESSKKNPESSKENSESSKKNPESPKENSESSKENSESSKENPESPKKNPESSKKNPESSKKNPKSSKKNPESSKKNPESSKKNPESSGESGDSSGESGDSSGESGDSSGESGEPSGESGESSGESGESSGESGESSGESGESLGESGESSGESGKSPKKSGKSRRKSGESVDKKKEKSTKPTSVDREEPRRRRSSKRLKEEPISILIKEREMKRDFPQIRFVALDGTEKELKVNEDNEIIVEVQKEDDRVLKIMMQQPEKLLSSKANMGGPNFDGPQESWEFANNFGEFQKLCLNGERIRISARMHKYRLISKKGEGTFSEVLKAQSIKTSRYVAIKCMKNTFDAIDQVNNLREIQALRRLSPYPHIVKLQEVLFDEPSGRLALVFELMDMNMYEAIRGRRHYLPEEKVKFWIYQVIKAMDHMHRSGIFHRDIKPENILIVNNIAKLADFGSCRGIHSKQPFTEYISTRWYRPPECLLTDGYYNCKMDMWGIGCVFFEVMALFPLFPGSNEIDQVQKIHSILGIPSPENFQKLKFHTSHIDFTFPPKKGTSVEKLIPNASSGCRDLILKLLAYFPEERYSARQSLKHAYFQELRDLDKMSQIFEYDQSTQRLRAQYHIYKERADRERKKTEKIKKKSDSDDDHTLPQIAGHNDSDESHFPSISNKKSVIQFPGSEEENILPPLTGKEKKKKSLRRKKTQKTSPNHFTEN